METPYKVAIDRYERWYLPALVISALVFFIPFLGSVHLFDWDEINFAESAREMIVSHNYSRVQINFQPFWEKPPLFFWLQVLSMKAFGINEFAARLPNAVCGMATLITLYFVGKKQKSPLFGFIWALCYLGSILPHLYFKSGIIDPVFNYFIFVGVYFMYRGIAALRPKTGFFILSGIGIGLANLTKGPVGLLLFILTYLIYYIGLRFKKFPSVKNILLFTLFFAIVSFFWFGRELITTGMDFLWKFLGVEADLFLKPVADHGEPFYYHFVVVFFGCFPISILALPVLFSNRFELSPFRKIMKILFWVVMILFSITTTKIIHYSSMTYFPLSFLAAVYVHHLITTREKVRGWVTALLLFVGTVFALLFTALPIVASHKGWLISKLDDPFAVANFQLPVHWSGWEFLIGLLYLVTIVIAIVMVVKRRSLKFFVLLFYSTALCMFFYLAIVVPKIEAYSQATAINFYKSIAGKNAYVTTIAFKSYAHYFYFQVPFDHNEPMREDKEFLFKGPIQKPAYLVSKITNHEVEDNCPSCKLIKEEGGFKFFVREVGK